MSIDNLVSTSAANTGTLALPTRYRPSNAIALAPTSIQAVAPPVRETGPQYSASKIEELSSTVSALVKQNAALQSAARDFMSRPVVVPTPAPVPRLMPMDPMTLEAHAMMNYAPKIRKRKGISTTMIVVILIVVVGAIVLIIGLIAGLYYYRKKSNKSKIDDPFKDDDDDTDTS